MAFCPTPSFLFHSCCHIGMPAWNHSLQAGCNDTSQQSQRLRLCQWSTIDPGKDHLYTACSTVAPMPGYNSTKALVNFSQCRLGLSNECPLEFANHFGEWPTVLPPANRILMASVLSGTVLPPASSILMAFVLTWTVLPPASSILMGLVLTWRVLPPANSILMTLLQIFRVLPPANNILITWFRNCAPANGILLTWFQHCPVPPVSCNLCRGEKWSSLLSF